MLRTILLTFCICLAASLSFGQTVSDNLLKNPGAENLLQSWNKLEDYSIQYTETARYVKSGKYVFLVYSYLGMEQTIDLSQYSYYIDNNYAEVNFSGWIYADDEGSETNTIVYRFLDEQYIEFSNWESGSIPYVRPLIYEKFVLQSAKIPPRTRYISVIILVKNEGNYKNYNFLDDLSLQIKTYNPPTSTPTATPTATPTVIPTPTPNNITPIYRNPFNEPNATTNNLFVTSPGKLGDFDLSTIYFGLLDANVTDSKYTDGFGILSKVKKGEGAIFYGKPIKVDNQYVYLSLSVSSSSKNLSLALGALDSEESDNLVGANLNGSSEVNLLFDCSKYLNQFGTFDAFYHVERGSIVPVFQIVNTTDNEEITVKIDNLEVYAFSQNDIPFLSK